MEEEEYNPIFTDTVAQFRERLENEEKLNSLKNFLYEGLNIFSYYLDKQNDISTFLKDSPNNFSDKIKLLINKGIKPMKNRSLRQLNKINVNNFIALLNKVPSETLNSLNLILDNESLISKLYLSSNLEFFLDRFHNYNINEHIKNLSNLFCNILTKNSRNLYRTNNISRARDMINKLITNLRYIYDNIYQRNPPRCILDINLRQEIIDALNREFPPNGLESLNISVNVRNSINSRISYKYLLIPQKLKKVNIEDEKLSNEFFDFIMEKYKPGITNKFIIEGESGIDIGGISRIVYNIFLEIFINKYFNENNGFYMVKFPITEDMKKATKIIISLAEKNNVKFVIPISTTLYYLLSLPDIEIIQQQFNIRNNFLIRNTLKNNKINVRLLRPDKKEKNINVLNQNYNPSFNSLKNQNAINYSRNILGNSNITNINSFIRSIFSEYVEEVNKYLTGNKKWNDLNDDEKNKIYFLNYLKYIEIKNLNQFNELHIWFQSIPDNIKTNEIKYDLDSVMQRVKFIIDNNRRNFNPNNSNNNSINKNTIILYNFLLNGTDKDRQKFIEFVSGSQFYTGEVKIFIFDSNSPKGNRPDYVFDAHTCFNFMNLFNSTEPITNKYIHNVLYGETGIHASNL
jgi:hypothetical protein